MKQAVVFIHGAGEGAYEEDGKLVASLRDGLGDGYDVRYPNMPEDNPEYDGWKATIAEELATLQGQVVFVGHSFGSSLLLKYLSEEQVGKPIAGIFLLATPFWNGEDQDWQYDGFALREDFATQLANIPHIFFYHSRDDDTVPFAHLQMYAAKLPQATIRTFDDRGHQFNDDVSEVAADIRNRNDNSSTNH